jgi:hypothetical protein
MVAVHSKIVVPIEVLFDHLDSLFGVEVVSVEEEFSTVIVNVVERVAARAAHDFSQGVSIVEGLVKNIFCDKKRVFAQRMSLGEKSA